MPQTQHPEVGGGFLFPGHRVLATFSCRCSNHLDGAQVRAGPQGGQGGGAQVQAEPTAFSQSWPQERARWPVRSPRAQTGGRVSQEGPIGQVAGQLRALAAPRTLHLPTPSHLPQRARMLLNRQKPNLLLHRDFCEVRGLNSPEVFARFGADSG